MRRIAIVGGGPGGLFSAYLLERRFPGSCSIVIFEASERVGGKIVTKQFASAPVRYEAGAAELYGYMQVGSDPLYNIVRSFGLCTVPLFGQTVIMDNRIMRSDHDISRHFGRSTLREIRRFHSFGKSNVSPRDYYNSGWPDDNDHRLANQTFETVLARIRDDVALRYIKVAVHSDLAAEPHQISGLFGVQNALIDDPKYVQLYSLRGGLEQLPQAVASRLAAKIRTNSTVVEVQKSESGRYCINIYDGVRTSSEEFDAIIVALPICWIPTILWRDRVLRDAMNEHHAFYSNPAHYLRITLLFKKAFWRHLIVDSFFQLDAFGGCCVYDEGTKQETQEYGVLSWLIAGNDALINANYDDKLLIRKALESLPASLAEGSHLCLEGRVDRWIGAVTGHAAGRQVRGSKIRHIPEPKNHPRLFVVGDYLFDSTINGTLDSAEIVSSLVMRSLGGHVNGAAHPRASKALKVGRVRGGVAGEWGRWQKNGGNMPVSGNGRGAIVD